MAELSPSVTDEEVLQQANARSAVLLTADKDFGELVFRQGLVHSGVILLRLAGLANATKVEIVAEACRDRATELVAAFSRLGGPSTDSTTVVTIHEGRTSASSRRPAAAADTHRYTEREGGRAHV